MVPTERATFSYLENEGPKVWNSYANIGWSLWKKHGEMAALEVGLSPSIVSFIFLLKEKSFYITILHFLFPLVLYLEKDGYLSQLPS